MQKEIKVTFKIDVDETNKNCCGNNCRYVGVLSYCSLWDTALEVIPACDSNCGFYVRCKKCLEAEEVQ